VRSGATPPRRAALDAVRATRRGELLDRAADSAFRGLDPRDRAWAQELAYGTIRWRGRLDHALAGFVRGSLDALQPDVLDVLRLGAYQLLEMGGVPAYAAVAQSRELVRDAGAPRAASLVAGVLHALDRGRDEVRFPDERVDPVGYLANAGSHPRWLVERWIRRWGAEAAGALVDANNRVPDVWIRPVGMEASTTAARLRDAGIRTEASAISGAALRLVPPFSVAEVLGLVRAVVQDPAAALVVDYAAAPAGGSVLDLCAAPGGKSAGLSERAGSVLACDVSARRIRRVVENVGRLDLAARIAIVVADARRQPVREGSMEMVLLDAPCTGTGTFRRHPDARWRISPEDVGSLTALQRELLDAAARAVRVGGWLVYSTCSVEEEENEVQVQRFLDDHPGWTLDPDLRSVGPDVLDARGFLVVLPHIHGVDGAFAARLRRVA
jgi:16S rRNA (cytosine967-C5)-methyltransferase